MKGNWSAAIAASRRRGWPRARWVVLAAAALFVALALVDCSGGGHKALPTIKPAGREIGRVTLPYTSGNKTVYIDDISPGLGSTAQSSPYAMNWGKMLSVSASGRQHASSPATSWTSLNGPLIVEHVAAVDPEGHLITYYWSADNDWKAVDVTERTGVAVAKEQPTAWTATWHTSGGDVLAERIAARDPSGVAWVFTWRAGHDWVAASTGQTFSGTLTNWTSPSGGATAEHVAGETAKGELELVWSVGGSGWTAVNVSAIAGNKTIAGPPYGWRSGTTTEHLAAADSSGHLILFTWTPSTDWKSEDVTARTTNTQLVTGRPAALSAGPNHLIASRAANDDVVVFTYDSIDTRWIVKNLNVDISPGPKIAASPVSWVSTEGSNTFQHLAAPDLSGHVKVFWRINDGSWAAVDVTQIAGVSTSQPLTAWASRSGTTTVEHLAAPTVGERLHVFTWRPDKDWTAVDVSTRSAGRVIYSAAPDGGVWISSDYGVNWAQSSRPQPAVDAADVPGALPVPWVLDVAVSPTDPNLAIAVTDKDNRLASLAGVYRTTDRGRSWARVHTFNCSWGVEAATQVVFAPDDARRVYVAGGCAIARSTSGGARWEEVWPPSTSETGNRVWHLAVSGQAGARVSDRRIVACGDGVVWLSRDDGGTWMKDKGATLPAGACSKTTRGNGNAAQVLAVEPNQPEHVYLAVDNYANGPSYYHPVQDGADGTFCNIPVVYDSNQDGKFDAGDLAIARLAPPAGTALKYDAKIRFFDTNKNGRLDTGESVVHDYNGNGIYDKDERVLRDPAPAVGAAVADDPRLKHADAGATFGPRGCGEGSLWYGDLTALSARDETSKGTWSQLPGPPVYYGQSTASGAAFVFAHPLTSGFLVFFADQDTLHVSAGKPTAKSWHRLDGVDAAAAHRQGKTGDELFVHVDPHGLAISPDFSLNLKPVTDQSPPYDKNTELAACGGGRLWLANDGGIWASDDCVQDQKWTSAYDGPKTLAALNIAGSTSLDYEPYLYFGTGDNDDFFSKNDGKTWQSPVGACGDCDTWYGDLYGVRRVLRLDPRWGAKSEGAFGVFTNPGSGQPDPSQGSQLANHQYPSGSNWYAQSWRTILGYRPVIQTQPKETPPVDGDYLVIQRRSASELVLLRANNTISTTGFTQVGPQLPNDAVVVQASGGHADPTYFIGNEVSLWRGTSSSKTWERIVPGGDASSARRFFVNPYDPQMVYLLDTDGVRLSTDGGTNWSRDESLSAAVSGNGAWPFTCSGEDCVLNDVVFDPTNSQRRFAAGLAGVFFTADGEHWFRLLDTRATPSRPRGLWFDPISRPNDAALYVATNGRGVLRMHPIPSTSPNMITPPRTTAPPPTPAVTPIPGGKAEELLKNGGFELGTFGWTFEGTARPLASAARTGRMGAGMGFGNDTADAVTQTATVPCDTKHLTLRFSWYISSQEGQPGADTLRVMVMANGKRLVLTELSNSSAQRRWVRSEFDLAVPACKPLTVRFQGDQNRRLPTTFYLDDVTLTAYTAS